MKGGVVPPLPITTDQKQILQISRPRTIIRLFEYSLAGALFE